MQDTYAVDNAIQEFIDRLIVIRTIKDHGIEQSILNTLAHQSKTSD